VIDVSGKITASIKAFTLMMKAVSTSETSISRRLHIATSQKTVALALVRTSDISEQNLYFGVLHHNRPKIKVPQCISIAHFYIKLFKIAVNLATVRQKPRFVAVWPTLPLETSKKKLLRYRSYTNRMIHYQYPLNCDGNFLTKNLTFTFKKINTSQWYWQPTNNNIIIFKLQRLFSLLKTQATWTTALLRL
jgi:hypothetical protein